MRVTEVEVVRKVVLGGYRLRVGVGDVDTLGLSRHFVLRAVKEKPNNQEIQRGGRVCLAP